MIIFDYHVPKKSVTSPIDDSHTAILKSGEVGAVSDVKMPRGWIVDEAVRTKLELDGIDQIKRVTAKNSDHAITSAGHKKFVEFTHVPRPRRRLESGDAADALPRRQIHNFQQIACQCGHKQALTLDIRVHVID